jgi:glycosyltransferase involved in cell wall biosynthesis
MSFFLSAPEGPGAPRPVVSVLMLTFNHERFLAQAIDSALGQRTAVPIEIVIGADQSPDHTQEIAREFGARYASRVRVLAAQSRLGMHENFKRTLSACRGRYIAILEGDDFWTDPAKVQTQVNVMEREPACTLCFHTTTKIWEDGSHPPTEVRPAALRATYAAEDLIRENIIMTPSVMFRANLWTSLPPFMDTIGMIDWPLHIINASFGHARFIDSAMATYRVHGGGIWSGKDYITCVKEAVVMFAALDEHLGFRYHHAFTVARRDYAARLSHYLVNTALQRATGLGALRDVRAALRSLPHELHANPVFAALTVARLGRALATRGRSRATSRQKA